ncbi:MAG TPA: ROK family protein [Stellaceae bacterium]|nr:ROK family protein [Stellaceae bacterium]
MSTARTLAIDIGGTGIKTALLDTAGQMVSKRQRVPTPSPPVSPQALIEAIDKAVAELGAFDRVSVGFPGYVRDGRIVTAPHLGTEALAGFDLQGELARHWGKPVRVLNDADVQGYGAIRGHGIEMVLTLGTGAGTALFRDGELLPHLELAHHPIRGRKTYDEYVGKLARDKKGKKAWNKRVARVIDVLREVVRFDHLYIGGGNASDLTFPLPHDVTVVPNTDGLTGGIRLWERIPHPVEPAPLEAPPAATPRDGHGGETMDEAASPPP